MANKLQLVLVVVVLVRILSAYPHMFYLVLYLSHAIDDIVVIYTDCKEHEDPYNRFNSSEAPESPEV